MSVRFFARTKRIFPNATRGREIVTALRQNRNEKSQPLTMNQIETLAVRGGKESAILHLMSLNSDKRTRIYDQIKNEGHHCIDQVDDCTCSEEWRFHRFFATQRGTTVCGPKKGNMARLQKMYKADFPELEDSLFNKTKTSQVGNSHFILPYTPYYLFPLSLYEKTFNKISGRYSGFREKKWPKVKTMGEKAGRFFCDTLFGVSYYVKHGVRYTILGNAFGSRYVCYPSRPLY